MADEKNATLQTAGAIASLNGKVALVTGGTAGIGQGTCIALAKAGAFVYVTGRAVDPERADVYGGAKGGSETVRQIEEAGGKGVFLKLDVTVEDDWKSAAAVVEKEHGRLDLLMNNAGRGRRRPIEELTLAEQMDQIRLNIEGAFLGMTAFWKLLDKTNGVIVNVDGGSRGAVTGTAYQASKAAMRGLSMAAAHDGRPLGIRVISLHPGATWTPGLAYMYKTDEQEFLDNLEKTRTTPLGYPAYPLDIGAAVVFLASDSARRISNIEMWIDGGSSAR
jgi:NAD(P)-dependent dehydrogenase (short-subunit alcohol dehydrogenase family)